MSAQARSPPFAAGSRRPRASMDRASAPEPGLRSTSTASRTSRLGGSRTRAGTVLHPRRFAPSRTPSVNPSAILCATEPRYTDQAGRPAGALPSMTAPSRSTRRLSLFPSFSSLSSPLLPRRTLRAAALLPAPGSAHRPRRHAASWLEQLGLLRAHRHRRRVQAQCRLVGSAPQACRVGVRGG